MLSCQLSSIDDAKKLVNLCMQYGEDIDVIHRRQIIDGKSLLGVISLVGNMVSVEMLTENKDTEMAFKKHFYETFL